MKRDQSLLGFVANMLSDDIHLAKNDVSLANYVRQYALLRQSQLRQKNAPMVQDERFDTIST